MDNAGEMVAELVRNHDRDRYSSILYAPEDRRGALFALAGFNIELLRIPGLVSEPMPGEIRFQWWRDALESGAAESGAGNPVAEMLGAAIERFGLPVAALTNMIEARIFDLYNDPMPSQTDLEGYLGETSGALIQMAHLVLEPDRAADDAGASGHAGCALGIGEILLSLPFHRSRGQCYLPRDMLAAAGLNPEEFASGEAGEAHWRAVEAMIALGREHYSAFSRLARQIPSKARPAYLPLSTVPHIFEAAEKARLSVFDTRSAVSPIRRQWSILRRAIGGW